MQVETVNGDANLIGGHACDVQICSSAHAGEFGPHHTGSKTQKQMTAFNPSLCTSANACDERFCGQCSHHRCGTTHTVPEQLSVVFKCFLQCWPICAAHDAAVCDVYVKLQAMAVPCCAGCTVMGTAEPCTGTAKQLGHRWLNSQKSKRGVETKLPLVSRGMLYYYYNCYYSPCSYPCRRGHQQPFITSASSPLSAAPHLCGSAV
jgi:hypothetical protein